MPRFGKKQIKELQEFLYHSYIHDAKLERISYNYRKKELMIETLNTIFDVAQTFIFSDVNDVLAVKGDDIGSSEVIISLAVEDDCLHEQNRIKYSNIILDNLIYLVFQMFSGDEIHIIAGEVNVEIAKQNTL